MFGPVDKERIKFPKGSLILLGINKSLPFRNSTGIFFYFSAVTYLLLILLMGRTGPIGKSLFLFGCLYTASFLLLIGLVISFPHEWPRCKQFLLIFGMATVSRIIFFAFPPSHDVNRYIWEGYILNQGFNPYLHAPDDPVLKPLVNHIWYNINHKDASACYPPLAILLFSFCATLFLSPYFFKAVIILFDLGLILVLGLLAKDRGIPQSRLMLYALNPLVLVFIAGEGHLDAIQAFFVCLSLLFFGRGKHGLGFFALGCAIMSKYFAVVLLPFVVTRRNWKKIGLVFVPMLAYVPVWDSRLGLFSSLVPFGTVMHYNDSVTVLLRSIFGTAAVWVSVTLLIFCLATIFVMAQDTLRSAYLSFGSLLLLLSTLHPWYLVLVTPFLVFFNSRAWTYLHFAVVFTFPVLHHEYMTGIFQEFYWPKLLEYLPFYMLLMWDFTKRRSFVTQPVFERAGNISVVIPTLNESDNISGAVKSLENEEGLLEKIVVDGGSSDDTHEKAKALGSLVIQEGRGRGQQIKAGVRRCKGDLILILHADCRLRAGTFGRILQTMNENRGYLGGAVGMRYSSESFKNKVLARLNNARARWTGISFGDQCQFFRRESLDMIGSFPDQMLMEDVELSMRLKEKGRVCFVPDGVIVSKRRWDRVGFWENCAGVVTLCLLYLVERRLKLGDTRREAFYGRYYGLAQK
jgi:rSAM/selenodomain-associated transferase 2